MTVAITSAGTEGRPRSVGNRSSNISSGKDGAAVLGQEGVHRALPEQVVAQGGGVQQRPVRAGGTLHAPFGSRAERNRESPEGYLRLLSGLL